MREKIVIYSRLRARRVEGTAEDVIPWLDTDTMSHSILYIRGGNRMALMTIGQVSEMLGGALNKDEKKLLDELDDFDFSF